MRIAVISNTAPPATVGGIGTAHYNLFQALIHAGHEARLFVYGPVDGIPYHRGLPSLGWRLIRKTAYLASKAAFGRKGLPVYADYVADAVSGLFLWPKVERYAPDVIVVPDHGPPSVLVRRKEKSKLVYISHHNASRFLSVQPLRAHGEEDVKHAVGMEQSAIIKADGVICPSTYMKDIFLRTYVSSCPVEVIPNVLDTEWLAGVPESDMRGEHGFDAKTPIVYIPSAGNPLKGAEFVEEIIRRLAALVPSDIAFYLSGRVSAEACTRLRRVAQNVRIIVPGNLPYQQNIANVKCCDLCVSPCLAESFGMALLEAELCGLPAVTFDAGGNHDVVIDGHTGYLVNGRDIDALIEYAGILLKDSSLRQRMGYAARQLSFEKFNTEEVLGRYIDYFRSL